MEVLEVKRLVEETEDRISKKVHMELERLMIQTGLQIESINVYLTFFGAIDEKESRLGIVSTDIKLDI